MLNMSNPVLAKLRKLGLCAKRFESYPVSRAPVTNPAGVNDITLDILSALF
jgi:hypothetical protein